MSNILNVVNIESGVISHNLLPQYTVIGFSNGFPTYNVFLDWVRTPIPMHSELCPDRLSPHYPYYLVWFDDTLGILGKTLENFKYGSVASLPGKYPINLFPDY